MGVGEWKKVMVLSGCLRGGVWDKGGQADKAAYGKMMQPKQGVTDFYRFGFVETGH